MALERIVGAAVDDRLGELGREEALEPPQPLQLADLVLDALLEGLMKLQEKIRRSSVIRKPARTA